MDRDLEKGRPMKTAPGPKATSRAGKKKIKTAFPLRPERDPNKPAAAARPARTVILESWQRCRASGIDPEQIHFRRVADIDLQRRLDANRELIDIASLHLDWISSSWARICHVVFLVDRDGVVLYVTGNDLPLREALHVLPGYDWSERQVGTNGPGTALLVNQAIGVDGVEHFGHLFHRYTCTGAPIHVDGEIIGAIGLGTLEMAGNPERTILTAHMAYVVEQELMHRRTERQAESMKTEAMTLLANSLDYKTTLSSVARLVVPRFADWCLIDMLEGDQSIVRLAVAQADPSRNDIALRLKRQPINPNVPRGAARVIRTGQSELYPEMSDSIREEAASDEAHLDLIRQVNSQSAMVVAIAGRGKVLGAITFISSESGRHYSRVDLALAEDLARRAALAIENAQLYRSAQEEIERRKRVEEALRRSREQLQAVLDNTTAVVYLMDLDNRFLMVNRQFESLFNLKNEAVRGRSIYGVFPKEVADAFRDNNKNVLEAGRPAEFDEMVPQADGVHVYLSIKVPLFDQTGKPHAVCGISSDITDRKRIETALRQKTAEAEEASRTKSQFVSMISHELRTPLNAIIGYSGLLRRPGLADDSAKRAGMTDRIYYNAQILLRLINNLLDLNRMEAGQMPVEAEMIFLADLVEEIVHNLSPMGEEKELKVDFINNDGPLPVRSDSKKIQQIITNLISNAIKFTDRGGVTVRLRDLPVERRVAVEVSDTGIGIGEADLPHLFEPFYQADTSDTRSYEGSGLGLSIVEKFTQLIGGEVRVASKVGVGTTFTVFLPYEMPT